jgi:NTE family protein
MTDLTADLVLEGGGVKGIALVGAISILEEAGYTFHRIAGTSAGAIVGAFLAADIRSDAMQDILQVTDYRRFQDKTLIDHLGPLGLAYSLLRTSGLYGGHYFTNWFERELTTYSPLAHQHQRPLTFGDLHAANLDKTPYGRLVVLASDLTNQRLTRLPWDYERYGLNPHNQPLSAAVRASMSIPYFFEPVRLQQDDDTTACIVDGGMLSNFPVAIFDRLDHQPPRWPTFGLKLSARPDNKKVVGKLGNPITMTAAMIATMMNATDNQHIDRADVIARTIFIDTFDISPVDFDLDTGTVNKLYESGRQAAQAFLDTWDFDTYIDTHRS